LSIASSPGFDVTSWHSETKPNVGLARHGTTPHGEDITLRDLPFANVYSAMPGVMLQWRVGFNFCRVDDALDLNPA
jgi:hypothetical protein